QPKVYTHEDKPGFSKKTIISDKDKKKNGSAMDDRKKPNKKEKIKKGYEQNQSSIEYDEISGEITKIRVRKSGVNEKKKHAPVVAAVIDHAVITSTDITIKQLSEKIGKSVAEIIKKLFFEYQIVKTINDNIDFDTAELISSDFGVTLKLELEKTSEEKLIEFHDENDDDAANKVVRPPIVTIMGHVDHGKTSILDYIRKSHVASGEAGGITQHIGAYTIQVPADNGEKKTITFLDTPGHEAFTAMRARGANITDIAVIVVAADDGIMPQTVEAIHHAKAAGVQMIVAINKMDKPTANPDKILQQLADNDVLVDEWNGDVPAVRVSAKTGQNIDQLLDVILMVAEMQELKANPDRSAHGTIIEARLDKGKGPVATVLVQNGTLHTGDFIVAGMAIGRVRAMFDDKGRSVSKATPSMPVSVLGLQEVPNAGDQMMVVVDEKLSRQVVEERKAKEKIEKLKARKTSLEDVFSRIEEGKLKDLNLILKADVQGSVEAVKASLLRLSNDEVKVHVVHSGVGAINESDVSLADTTNAIIIGFNIRPDTN
ncbi:MAG: translation initiation factor IF-2, partial [Clostridia bacterium]|nr:translation initiation factor IF-2 [Clostridia bacterium]